MVILGTADWLFFYERQQLYANENTQMLSSSRIRSESEKCSQSADNKSSLRLHLS